MILGLLSTSCAQKTEQSYEQPERIYSSHEIRIILSNHNLENTDLRSHTHYHSPVGVLYSAIKIANNQYKMRLCTATFLNDREVITAAHCIPMQVRNNPEACGLLHFSHPKDDQLIACESLKWMDSSFDLGDDAKYIDSKNIKADVAILTMRSQLENVAPLKLSTTNTSGGKLLSFVKYTSKNIQELFFSKSTCHVSGSFGAPHPFRTSDCGPIPSNSGAPLLNEQNNVQGIIVGSNGLFVDTYCIQKDNIGNYSWKTDNCPVPNVAK